MARKSKLKLKPLTLDKSSFGRRLAGIRKEKGYTQVELAEKIGVVQNIISAYECDRMRPYAEMIARLAIALKVSTDELIGTKTPSSTNENGKPPLRLLKRMRRIENLPTSKQKTILATIDAFLKGVESK